ncbi:spore germination protein [Pelosinus sp. IPA-1]|uniref:spore germination protein n=1 Tax=Pelosinus sp. IPA-1 TaxID=3029569 RepID=UPI0024361E41|nr:spore germination protein [Pelosinus sp. IPA-1]GMA98857.1 spore germination protein [Pelosinus sp. IPA-1]
MKRGKNLHNTAPSTSISKTSQDETANQLAALKQLSEESNKIAQDISQIITQLKQTPTSADQGHPDSNKKEKYFEGQYYLHKEIEANLTTLKTILGKSDDIIFRDFIIGVNKQIKVFLCFIDGLGDKKLIDEYIVKPLLVNIHIIDPNETLLSHDIPTNLKDHLFNAVELKKENEFDEVLDAVLGGNTALFIDGYDTVLILSAKGGETRSIKEPETETIVRGSREGFVETLRVNTSLIRRIIKNPNLIIESFRLGTQTHTDINIVYIDGIANPKTVEEVKSRLNEIDTNAFISPGYLEQNIEDAPLSFFSTMASSERPERVTAKILEGKVAILVNGTPFVLTVPHLFIENFQVTEDYTSKFYFASFVRLLRLLAFFITLFSPALYVAVETFHQEMLPTVLLITAAATREGIPFPCFLEILIMSAIFELLRESGVRLPRQIGQAVSIVGALVVGDAIVRAGIISAPMVIIGAITTITSFIIPTLLEALLFFRLFLLLLSASLGFYGFIVGLIIIIAHMCSIRSFGTPYLSPLAPVIWKDLKDSFILFPLWLIKALSKLIPWKNSKKECFSSSINKSNKKSGENN